MQKFFKRVFVSVKVFWIFVLSLQLMIDEHPENLNRYECRLKKFCMQKGTSCTDNSGIKEFGQTSFEQERKQCLCKKLIASYK